MKRFYLCLLALTLMAGSALADPPVVDAGWSTYIIRNGGTGSPVIQDNDDIVTDAIEIATWEASQKAGLGTDLINGARISQITSLHIDRLDNVAISGSLYGPYFNIWVTDGLGHYAVLANEPSDAEWAGSRWDVPDWDFLKTKRCKVYETTGASGGEPGTSWVATWTGMASGLVFEDVADLIIAPPSVAYILAGNGVGGGAPDELGTNIARGFNWMFGDTMANYVTGGDGFIVDNYSATATFSVTNVTQGTHFAMIQPAVDAANPGDAITVAAGHYVEQVHITVDNLSITGAGTSATLIDSPVTLALSYTTSDVNKAVVFVDHADGVALSGLTVDGLGRGNTNYRFQGVGYWNSGGSMTSVNVVRVRDTPFSGAQHGVGVYTVVTDATPHTFAMTDVLVGTFQKTAVVLAGTGLNANLLRVTTNGSGGTTVTAQNGIQVSGGANATAVDCDVSNVNYTGADWTATGLLAFGPGTADFDGCTVNGCQTSVYFIDASGSFDNSDVINPAGDAFYAYSYAGPTKSSTFDRRLPQPMDEGRAGTADKVAMTVTITGSTFIGTGLANSWGPSAYTDDPITFTMDDCEVANWDYGIVLYNFGDAVFDATVVNSNIHDNLSYGLYSNAAETATATCNWWGDLGGPDTLANPSPGDVLEGFATYAPWLNGVGGACVAYGNNNVSVGDAAVCVTPTNTCVSLPVTFNRLDTTASRGVSVTIQLSPELVLCTNDPGTDITMATGPGSWSGGFGNLVHQVVNNGGGSYTIDRAILGAPCGPTNGGLLFHVNVKQAPSVTTETIGTVSVTYVDVRDCLNAQIAGIPGAAGEVGINLTVPAALTGLTAVQDKSGNGSDGRTAINLAWTAPTGDADFINIYRKGFGFYPEYNDNVLGAAPAAPVTVGNGWVLAATVPGTSTAYADEPPTRDFWSYAAFVADECGNTSPVSAITAGTLDYHLGDVVAAGGDNLVDTADMSLLGFYYGNTGLPYGDARNVLDVGPTTNFSVDARPTTDNRIQFEDLMMFAINHNQVSKIESQTRPAAVNAVALAPEAVGAVGSTFDVAIVLSSNGAIQGLSVPLTWDATVVVPVDMRAGDLLSAYGAEAMVLSPEPGTVDAALMGVRSQGIAGQGVLATVTFRVVTAGDAKLGLGNVSARDSANQPVVLNGAGNLPPVSLPSMSELHSNVPNPFNPSTEFSFVLAQDGPVSLRVYSVRGELVRTLVDQDMTAGPHALIWNGVDDQGRQAASGGYIVRFVAPDRTQSRNITLLK